MSNECPNSVVSPLTFVLIFVKIPYHFNKEMKH
jgi:hypothetical protein